MITPLLQQNFVWKGKLQSKHTTKLTKENIQRKKSAKVSTYAQIAAD